MVEDDSFDYQSQSPVVVHEETYGGYEITEEQSGYQLHEDQQLPESQELLDIDG